MKKNIYLSFLLFNILSFGQIKDPAPNFDAESLYKPKLSSEKWNFSHKAYKKITTIKDNKISLVEEFDSLGRSISTSVDFGDFTSSSFKKYKNNDVIEYVTKKTYKLDQTGKKKGIDEMTCKKINFNSKGKIIDCIETKLTKEGLNKIVSRAFYDKKNRLIKSMDTMGINSTNYYYSKNNLIKQEVVYQKDINNKTITERIYKYNKDNQIYFSESSKNKYVNNKLIEKKVYYTVNQTFKNKLLIKKVLKDDSVIDERIYTYDDNKNLISFLETRKNTTDDLVIYQKKTTHKYENNNLIYSERFDGSSSHSNGQYSFTYLIYSDTNLLNKTVNTYDVEKDRKAEVEYLYNEFNHLVKTISTNLGSDKHNETVYEIEYY